MLEQGVIEASNSRWASPIVLVKKRDGSLRFCIDFLKANAITRKDSNPLPRIDGLLDSLNQSKYFSTEDLHSGFWQIAMDEEAKPKTAFTSHFGLYQFTKMPYGLTAAPATFQMLMDCVLTGRTGLICLVCLDDVIIFTTADFLQHVYDVLVVLWTLLDVGLKVKSRKCQFARKRFHFLTHIVSQNSLEPDPEKGKAVTECPVPENITKV